MQPGDKRNYQQYAHSHFCHRQRYRAADSGDGHTRRLGADPKRSIDEHIERAPRRRFTVGRLLSGEAVLIRVADGLGSIVDAGFGEEVVDVCLDR